MFYVSTDFKFRGHPTCESPADTLTRLQLVGILFYSYHFTFPNCFLGIILKIKMNETVFTNTFFNSEIRIFYQFFIVIINQVITSIGFNLKINVKQLVRSWKPPSTKILNWQNILSCGIVVRVCQGYEILTWHSVLLTLPITFIFCPIMILGKFSK